MGGGELANYCDVDTTLANAASTRSIAATVCTWCCIATLCVSTALLAWPPYQRLQNGPDTHSSLRLHPAAPFSTLTYSCRFLFANVWRMCSVSASSLLEEKTASVHRIGCVLLDYPTLASIL